MRIPKEKFNTMTNSRMRFAAALLFAVTLASASTSAQARETGSRIHLEALPTFVERVFVPVVPRAENKLTIANLVAESVIEAPEQFDVRIVNGSVAVYSDGGDAAGYAKVRAGGRDL